jgi:hypothetical protein
MLIVVVFPVQVVATDIIIPWRKKPMTVEKIGAVCTFSGDEIQEQPFWGSFLRSARRRDNIVRKGLIVGRTDAEESIAAADDFLAHLTG